MPLLGSDLLLANRNNVSYRTTGLELANYVNGGVDLEYLGIANHNQMVVSPAGDVTANSFSGDGSNLTNVPQPTLSSLGIANHDNVTVDATGNVTATSFNGDGSGLTGIQAGTWEKIASSNTASGAQSTVVFNGFSGYRYVKVYCTLRSFTSSASNRQPSVRFLNSSNASITTGYWGGGNGLNGSGAHYATNTGSDGNRGRLVFQSDDQLPVNSDIGTFCEFYMRVGTYPILQWNIANFLQWNGTSGYGYGKVNGFCGSTTTANCVGFQVFDNQGNTVGTLDYYIEGLKL